jgi:hypothetical protein
MNLTYTVFSSLGLSTLLVCVMSSAQARPNPSVSQPSKPITKLSSSLGGPITPTQPDFFAGSNPSVPPASMNQTLDSGFKDQPVQARSDRPAAPMVDDPPRPTKGGIINIKTD